MSIVAVSQLIDQVESLGEGVLKFVLLSQVVTTCFMTGLIWFVQIVHYPMFSNVGSDQFVEYESRHQRLTTYVVMPVMLIELATAVLLVSMSPPGSRVLPWTGLILLIIVWLSTWALQVPAHQNLAAGFLPTEHMKLVNTNWIRTFAWTARVGVLCAMLYRILPGSGS